jgi:hypothetical protein
VNQIRIGVKVPLAAAVAAGRAQYGYDSVTLTDAGVALLSANARALLHAWEGSTGGSRENNDRRRGLVGIRDGQWTSEVEVAQADVPTVLAAIEAIAERVRTKAARELEEYEAEVGKALAQPDSEWVTGGYANTAYYTDTRTGEYSRDATGVQHPAPLVAIPVSCYLSSEQKRDPRVVARLQHVEANVLPDLRAEHDRRYAEWIAVRNAAGAERETREATWRSACAAYVLRWVPEYARAARDGCDVRGLARETSVAACTEMIRSLGLETVETYTDAEPHPRPHHRAYEALDRVTGLLNSTHGEDIAAASPGLVDRISTRIVRADTCEANGCKLGIRTCIEVTLHYIDDRTEEIYVYADGAPPHLHDDEE